MIIRLVNTHGPKMRSGDFYGRVMDRFIQQAIKGEPLTVYGNGKQTSSFTYVEDCVRAMVLLMFKGVSGCIYNIGSDKESEIIEVATMIRDLKNSPSKIEYRDLPHNDPKRRSGDISKIRKMDWKPSIDLQDGILLTVEYYVRR